MSKKPLREHEWIRKVNRFMKHSISRSELGELRADVSELKKIAAKAVEKARALEKLLGD